MIMTQTKSTGNYEVDVVGQQVTATQIGITETGFGQVDYNGSGLSDFHGDQQLKGSGSTKIPDPYIFMLPLCRPDPSSARCGGCGGMRRLAVMVL